MKKCGDEARRRISWLLDLEKRPRTLNDHYYSDYRDKFLAYYRGCRHSDRHGSLITSLQAYRPPKTAPSPNSLDFNSCAAKALSGLQEIGIDSKATDLPKLLPSDPLEPALHIMATVRAYFQGTPS